MSPFKLGFRLHRQYQIEILHILKRKKERKWKYPLTDGNCYIEILILYIIFRVTLRIVNAPLPTLTIFNLYL